MKSILIIDQQPFSRIHLKDALDGEYHVLEAAGSAEAVACAQRHPIDLILLDMERRENDGPAICLKIKELPATKYIPLILLSSCDQRDEIINGLHAGAEDYLTKPVSISELFARVDAHLRTKDYYADLEKEDLLMLLELMEAISVTRNPKKIFSAIVDKMTRAIDVSRCSIISLNDDGDLIVKASSDLADHQEIRLNLNRYPEIEKALHTQRPVVLNDLHNNPLMASVRERISRLSDQAIFVVPIIKKQNVIGTFFLRTASPSRGWVSRRVFKLCQLVANISGNALENAVLFESMQANRRLLEDLALRDSLTMLYNHQQFHSRMDEEFSRACRYGLPLSCVFADIDDFKKINDTFGHVTGDVVLKQIGKLIQGMLRQCDLAARYGGEEFSIMLPNTDEIGARQFAERLKSAISDLSIQPLQGERVAVSVGVSTLDRQNLTNYAELIQLADQEMYQEKQAKKSGQIQPSLANGSSGNAEPEIVL